MVFLKPTKQNIDLMRFYNRKGELRVGKIDLDQYEIFTFDLRYSMIINEKTRKEFIFDDDIPYVIESYNNDTFEERIKKDMIQRTSFYLKNDFIIGQKLKEDIIEAIEMLGGGMVFKDKNKMSEFVDNIIYEAMNECKLLLPE